jgi:hypothetical protein
MASESIDLKVVIDENQISAENLGIIPYGQRNIHLRAQIIYGTFRSFRSGFKLDYRTKSNAEKKKLLLNIKNKC